MTNKLKNILCIDDEPDVLSVAQMCLETVGEFNVTTASSGNEGLEKMLANKPDVILLDVMMPGIDGPATLKLVRKHPDFDDVPIIFMTARVRPSEIQEYLALGANGVMPKPFDPMTLSAQVTEIWEKFLAEKQ